jgi:hypothetical protein
VAIELADAELLLDPGSGEDDHLPTLYWTARGAFPSSSRSPKALSLQFFYTDADHYGTGATSMPISTRASHAAAGSGRPRARQRQRVVGCDGGDLADDYRGRRSCDARPRSGSSSPHRPASAADTTRTAPG